MKNLECKLRFLTPAFLGNAEQGGEFRTPPIKALLRQFWRMVQASHGVNNVDELRRREHALFGSASGDSGHKSLVRLHLDCWEAGKLTNWGKLATQPINVGKNSVSAALYLGFGPLTYQKALRGPAMEHAPALEAGASTGLRIAVVPHDATANIDLDDHHRDLLETAALMHHFGTLGSRSRNGWGSFALEGLGRNAISADCMTDWQEALNLDWPSGLGMDGGRPLVWRSVESFDTWEKAIIRLGQTRADVNRSGGDRTLLSYPITKQSRPNWRDQDRLPSNLRFKVVRDRDNKFRAQIAHFPCRPSAELSGRGRISDSVLVDTWNKVHAQLDRNAQLQHVALEDLA